MAPSKARQGGGQLTPPADLVLTSSFAGEVPPLRHKRGVVLTLCAVLAMTLLVYWPSMHGGILWDDPAHLTTPEFQSLHGLWRIWFEPGATQQYYPLMHTVFWFEYQLWGYDTFGYHLVNVLLHFGSAVLVWRILTRLGVRGAAFAALLFLWHPVHVESVAWMTQLKNTMSGFCYLAAFRCYLGFDTTRDRRWYAAALLLFAAGLLTKTVVASLPAAILVVIWWQRGRLDWRKDIVPTLPFFALGLVGGLYTAWFEYTIVGASGGSYQLPLLARVLLAGRVACFYLFSLLWPAKLIFFYPRWDVDSRIWWQWLFPIALVALLIFLWRLRHTTRAPLAATLFFLGTLFPVLGFVNVYPFRFSYVADHFQYLASLGVLALVAYGITAALSRVFPAARAIPAVGVPGVLLVVMAALTWRQSRDYGGDDIQLYRATIERNPGSWVAHQNWGGVLMQRGKPQEAIPHLESALYYHPNYAAALSTFGYALMALGQNEAGVDKFRQAADGDTADMKAQYEYAELLASMRRTKEAVPYYRRVVVLSPRFAMGFFTLGVAFTATGDTVSAHEAFDRANAFGRNSQQVQRGLISGYRALGDTQRSKAAAERLKVLAGGGR